MQPYAPRSIRVLPIRFHQGWAIKCYSISISPRAAEEAEFAGGAALALRELPLPAVAPGRIGVAVLIYHQGRGVDYTVLAWWDRENELPIRVFVSEVPGADWRPARGAESICVWDLEVLWRERELYVATVLGGQVEGARESYLARPAFPA